MEFAEQKQTTFARKHKTHTANLCPHFIKTGMSLLRSEDTMEAVWHGLPRKKAVIESQKSNP